jgi:hypothetical protein
MSACLQEPSKVPGYDGCSLNSTAAIGWLLGMATLKGGARGFVLKLYFPFSWVSTHHWPKGVL